MSEDGMSLAFREFGLDKIQGKLKSIERTSNGIARVAKMGGNLTGGGSSFINAAANTAIIFQSIKELDKVFKFMKVFSRTATSALKMTRIDKLSPKLNAVVGGAVTSLIRTVGPMISGITAALAAPVTLVGAGIAALSAVALAGLGVVALYFNLDKKISSAWKWVSTQVSKAMTVVGNQVSKAVKYWTRVAAKLSHRGDLLERGYNIDRMKYVLDISDRKNYKDTVTQDLYAAGDSEAVDIQRAEMNKAFAENDKKLNKEIMAMAEYMAFSERE